MTTVITIASGKGGAGKSSLSVNFALRLQAIAGNTLLVDYDLLAANTHILLGLKPKVDLISFLDGECKITDAIHKTTDALSILPGRTGASVELEKNGDPLKNLIPHIRDNVDGMNFAVIDAPAGASRAVLNSMANSDHVVIVLLKQATSFVDAYSLIKNAYFEHRITQFNVVVNLAESKSQARLIFDFFARTASNLLPVSVIYAGHVEQRDAIANSDIRCQPIVQFPEEKCQIAAFDTILKKILASPRNDAKLKRDASFGVMAPAGQMG